MKALENSSLRQYEIPDHQVVSRVVAGEKEWFEILMRRYNQSLYRAVRSYLKEEADVEDAMQETYAKAYQNLYQFRGEASFPTWLIRIGINEALLRIRKLKKQENMERGIPAWTDENLEFPDHQPMNPETKAIHSEMRSIIEAAVDRLPEKYRVVYMLREVEGLSNPEIATTLQISGSNVKMRVHRAKNLLKDELMRMSSITEIFEFGNTRCNNLVSVVMKRI